MPGYDGTGPSGKGPMSGQGRGFCVLQTSEDDPQQIQGFVGIDGQPVSNAPARSWFGRVFQWARFGRRLRRGRGRGRGRGRLSG